MSEFTKGKLIAEVKQSDLGGENPRCSIGIKGGKILFHSTYENSIANSKEFVRRWNSQPDLLEACKGLMKAWNSPGSRSMEQLKTDMDLAYDVAETAIRKAQLS